MPSLLAQFSGDDNFLNQAASSLPEIGANLNRLEQAPDDAQALQDAYRRIYRIGAAAAGIGFSDLARIAQAITDVLGDTLDEVLRLDRDALSLLHRSLERVRLVVELKKMGAGDARHLVAEDEADHAAFRQQLENRILTRDVTEVTDAEIRQWPPELQEHQREGERFSAVPDLSNPAVVRRLLQRHGARPQKTFGQYWLEDRQALGRIVAAAELSPGGAALEVGAGMGVLTVALAQVVGSAGRVVAVEIERDVLAILREVTAPLGQVEIVPRNLLEVEPHELFQGTPYALVANLPYYITAAALRHFLECAQPPQRLVVLVQQEVAERLTAAPGDLSLLGVSVQFYGQTRLVARVPASSFYPAPRVDSAIVRIDVSDRPLLAGAERERFFQVVRAGFGQKRKTLRNALMLGLDRPAQTVEAWLGAAGIDGRRRAETLSLEEWERVTRAANL